MPFACADDVVFLAVTGRGVDCAGSLLQRHVIAQDAERITLQKRMAENRSVQFRALEMGQPLRLLPSASLGRRAGQFLRDDVDVSGFLDRRVGVMGVKRDREIGRDGPGRRGPDQPVHPLAGERGIDRGRIGRKREPNPDRRAGMVLILDLRFGQRGAIPHAPVHRLQSLIDVALVQKIDERLGDHAFVLGAHGEIGVLPAAQYSEPDKVLALQVHVLFGVFAARGPDLGYRHAGLFRAKLAVDFDLDRKTVAIPAGHIGRVEALHGFHLDDEILQQLIERVAQVNVAVGVGRTVVKNVSGLAFARFANALIKTGFVPVREELRLQLREVRLHRKTGAGKVDGGLQIDFRGLHRNPSMVPDHGTAG